MEKGIIVVDVPKNCRECHLRTASLPTRERGLKYPNLILANSPS